MTRLSFPYRQPSLLSLVQAPLTGTQMLLRPFLTVTLRGPSRPARTFSDVLVDTGAVTTVFPTAFAELLGVQLQRRTRMEWRGTWYDLQYGTVELEIADEYGFRLRWPAEVGFSPARMRYQILGQFGGLAFFNAVFRGGAADLQFELEPNGDFPGSACEPPGRSLTAEDADS